MRFMFLLALAVLTSCAAADEPELMSEGCDVRAVSEWAAGDQTLWIEATTAGPDCARGVATLVVRNTSGEAIYTESFIAGQVMVLAGANDLAAMQTALDEWVAPQSSMTTTGALPEWPANVELPGRGDFPFYPDNHPYGYSREAYAALRAANDPMFCFVQGMESLGCIIYGDGGIEHIGVQTFPG
jgi:hypothetical protein